MFVGRLCLLLCVCGLLVVVSGTCSIRHSINTGGDQPADPRVAYGTPSGQALVLWVTRGVFSAGSFGSVSGLDDHCTATQPTGTIGSFTHQSQTRIALISNSTINAIDRIPQGVDIVNSKGQCIASDVSDLFSNLVLSWLLLDETGATLPNGITSSIFTGTDLSGNRAGGSDPAQYCNDWSSSSSSLSACQSGEVLLDGSTFSQWVTGDTGETCDKLIHFYCISAVPAPTQPPTPTPSPTPTIPDSGGQGDPQFVGLQGQSFQVHGIPDEYFNLLSHPFTQLNSHLTYLATGTCNYNDTLCWSHPGTYVDELGVMLPGVQVAVLAGPHSQGLTVTVNGKQLHVPKQLHTQSLTRQAGGGTATLGTAVTLTFPIQLDNDTITSPHHAWLEPPDSDMNTDMSGSGSGSVPWWSWLRDASCRVSFHSHNRVVISTPVATLDIYNAEHFFNFQLEFRAPRLLLAGAPLHRVHQSDSVSSGSSAHPVQAKSSDQSPHPHFPMHGLIGQTWKNVRYPNGRLYAGTADDYMLTDRRLFSTQFHFNEYLY